MESYNYLKGKINDFIKDIEKYHIEDVNKVKKYWEENERDVILKLVSLMYSKQDVESINAQLGITPEIQSQVLEGVEEIPEGDLEEGEIPEEEIPEGDLEEGEI